MKFRTLFAIIILATLQSNGQWKEVADYPFRHPRLDTIIKSNGQDTTKLSKGSLMIPKEGLRSLITGSTSGDTAKLLKSTMQYVSSRYPEWRTVDWNAPRYVRFFDNNHKMTAELKAGSDTLFIYDSVLHFSGNIPIRYIKINGKVYPLKEEQESDSINSNDWPSRIYYLLGGKRIPFKP